MEMTLPPLSERRRYEDAQIGRAYEHIRFGEEALLRRDVPASLRWFERVCAILRETCSANVIPIRGGK